MENFFDLFDAEFEEPAKSAIQPSTAFNDDSKIKEMQEIIAEQFETQPPRDYNNKVMLWNPDIPMDVLLEAQSKMDSVGTASPNLQQPDYTNMPQGLKEVQELNGVKDHGLPKKLVKGSLVAHHGDVFFEISEKGAFSIADPDYLSPVLLDILHRKFPGKLYYGTTDHVIYTVPEAKKETVTPAEVKPAVDLNDEYEAYLKANKGHISYDKFVKEVYVEPTVERTPMGTISTIVSEMDQQEKETLFGADWLKGLEEPEVPGFDIEPEQEDNSKVDLFSYPERKNRPENTYYGSQATPEKKPVHINDIVIDKPKRKFGRERFAKAKPAEGEEPDKRKIKANKKEQDGLVFDSTLELYMYNLLKQNNIRFDLKTTYVLQEGFVYRHESIQPMRVTPDFILLDYPVIIDTKGFSNERAPMQYKMLKYQFYTQGKEINILMPSNQQKCRNIIEGLLHGFTLEEPLTEHAATARKNKMLKLGFKWEDGNWVSKTGEPTSAKFIMNLPKYEFEEFLLKHK